jgi:hypothetical protein
MNEREDAPQPLEGELTEKVVRQLRGIARECRCSPNVRRELLDLARATSAEPTTSISEKLQRPPRSSSSVNIRRTGREICSAEFAPGVHRAR